MNPVKHKNEEVVLINVSINFYGKKFGQSAKKRRRYNALIIEFYGKLSLEKQLRKYKGKLKPKLSLNGGEMKQIFKKKQATAKRVDDAVKSKKRI